MFRRSKTPPPRWQARVDEVRALIREHAAATSASGTDIDRVAEALEQADADLARLDAAIERLDPDAATAELKAALRARVDPTAEDTALITSLRQRRQTVIGLQNRRNELSAGIDATLVDLDAFAARLIELSFVAGGPAPDIGELVDELNRDADALLAAHGLLSDIQPGVLR